MNGQDTEQFNFDINVENSDVKNLGVEFNKVDEYVLSIVNHLTQVENKILKIQNVTKNTTNNITHNKGTNFNGPSNVVLGTNGTAVSTSSPNSNAYKQAVQNFHDYQIQETELLKQQVETEKEITRLKKELANTVRQDSDARALNAKTKNDKYKSQWYQDSIVAETGYKNEKTKWLAYRNANPEKFLAGGLNANWTHQFSKSIDEIGNSLKKTSPVLGRLLGDVANIAANFLKSPAAGITTLLSKFTDAVIDLGKACVQAYSEIESLKTQLGVVFSNQSQADSMFGQISQYAVKSPFGVQQTSELAVLLKQSGVYASDLMDTLRMLGDTAGGNMEKMKRIANNYAQIVSIGKASMLDMRQFAYAGIPIFEAVSKELGVSQQELRKLISDGKVTSDIIEKVFKDLTGINGIFENATEKGAKTLKARLQNLQDARQLAAASGGEWLVHFGEGTGNDSIANKLVTTAENIYQLLQETVNTVNIEKSVKVIERRNDRITQLEDELRYLRENGGKKSEIKEVEKLLAEEMAKRDIEAERVSYYNSYQRKYNSYDRWQKEFNSYEGKKSELDAYYREMGYSPKSEYSLEEYQSFADILGFDNLSNVISELIKATEGLKNITEEEVRANRETNLINAQQLAFDKASKIADKELSYNSAFEQLYSIYTNSDEYKEQKQKEELALLKEAKAALIELSKFVDKEGNFDITQLSYGKFSDLYNNKGAFSPARKLQIVQGNAEATAENRKLLTSQWNDMSDKIAIELGKKNKELMVGFRAAQRTENNLNGTDKEFFDKFDTNLEAQLNFLQQLINIEKEKGNEKGEEYYQEMYNNLLASTFGYTLNDKGKNANPEDLLKGATKDFVPLWKRILAQYTGLSTQGMTGTVQTLTNYRDDMAIRNMTSSVLSATMKTMGVDTAMSLMRSGEGKQLRGDTGGTFQINWKETKKAVHDFALQLSASTEVVTAYKNGLQAELDTYEQLIAAGYTQGESQDLSQQKLVSSKKMAELAQDAGEQLVNAFGEVIETESGKRYNTSELKVDEEGNLIVAKTGEKIEEQVRLTGNLFEFIKKELPELRKDIHEATSQELMDKELEKLYNEVKNSFMTNALREELGYSRESEYLMNNPDLINSYIDSALTRIKDTKKAEGFGETYDGLLDKANSDIIITALKFREGKTVEGNVELGLLREAVQEAAKDVELLINDKGFLTLSEYLKNRERDTEAENAVRKMADSYTRREAERNIREGKNPLNPNEPLSERDKLKYQHESLRGGYDLIFKNYFGLDRKSDKIDRYARMATTANLEGKDVNPFGVNADNFQNMSAEEIYQSLSAVERQTLNWKAALEDTGEVIKDMGENLLGVLGDFSQKAWVTPFEEIGKAFVTGEDAAEGIRDAYKNLGGELLKAAGTTMVQAGFSLVSRGAADDNIGMIAGGLALAAAGGVSTGIGSALTSNKESKDESKDQTAKLEKLKDDLVTLLKQAREDAIYYENTLRHKSAISANAEFTMKKVNDAIITPSGDVISTHPEDYLIATKTPRTLLGNGGGTPTVNFSVIDKSTGIKVTQQRANYNSQNNTLDFEVMVESKIKEVIASGKSDGAFNARDARLRGRNVIA